MRLQGIESNLTEMRVWKTAEHLKSNSKNWLAPSLSISMGGIALIQQRAEPLPEDYQLPERVPCWITDLKPSNCGLLNGKFVFVDYGLNNCNNMGIGSNRTKLANWF